jgi:integrase/recombinase XerD
MSSSGDHVPLILKMEFWPKADVAAWKTMFDPGDDWGEGRGPAAAWSNGTVTLRLQGYGQWLSYLVRNRRELLTLPPQDRVTRETVSAYFVECENRISHRSIATLLSNLAEVMRALFPDADWSWIRRASSSFVQTSRHQELKPLPNVTAAEVFSTAIARLQYVRNQREITKNATPIKDAVEFRQALMVALLISCPVRSRALLSMTAAEHFERLEDEVFLVFRVEDMKDKKAHRFLLHPALDVFLCEYLETHRPLLLGGAHSDMLWISSRGNDLQADSFNGYLAIWTERHFGYRFRAHKFRHIAATSISEEMPEHFGIIADILGHSTLAMAEKHYNRAKGVHAKQRLKAIVSKFKKAK